MALQTSLTAEQMAAYLDGMLSDEENQIVENLISQDAQLQEISDVIDAVDETYIYNDDVDIPLECYSDNFCLPEIETEVSYETHQEDFYDEHYHDDADFNDDYNDTDDIIDDCQDDNIADDAIDDILF
jgi:hypothetical protein